MFLFFQITLHAAQIIVQLFELDDAVYEEQRRAAETGVMRAIEFPSFKSPVSRLLDVGLIFVAYEWRAIDQLLPPALFY